MKGAFQTLICRALGILGYTPRNTKGQMGKAPGHLSARAALVCFISFTQLICTLNFI